MLSAFRLLIEIEHWPLKTPFRITGHAWESLGVVVVALEAEGRRGVGEAAGVFYREETPDTIARQIESVRSQIESNDFTAESLQTLVPPGGARNALDCALWDWRAKTSGQPVWQLAGMCEPQPLITTFTCGADTPEAMAATARSYAGARAIKLKLTGHDSDADRVEAVRAMRPDVWLGVDANQGFTRASLERLMPTLVKRQVSLIEQPFPIGKDDLLDGLDSPIPLAADESAQTVDDLPGLVGRFQVVNIKLDKCGGLTHALAMARAAGKMGLETMVGNMMGTSLAMAPAFLVGQLCKIVDLDGPIFLKADRAEAVHYANGLIHCTQGVW